MDGLIICLLVVIIALQVFFRPRKDHSDIAGELKRLLDEMQRSFERIEKNFREDFRLNREEGRIVARDNREELTRSMNEFRDAFDRGIARSTPCNGKSSPTWTNNNACLSLTRKNGWKKSA